MDQEMTGWKVIGLSRGRMAKSRVMLQDNLLIDDQSNKLNLNKISRIHIGWEHNDSDIQKYTHPRNRHMQTVMAAKNIWLVSIATLRSGGVEKYIHFFLKHKHRRTMVMEILWKLHAMDIEVEGDILNALECVKDCGKNDSMEIKIIPIQISNHDSKQSEMNRPSSLPSKTRGIFFQHIDDKRMAIDFTIESEFIIDRTRNSKKISKLRGLANHLTNIS